MKRVFVAFGLLAFVACCIACGGGKAPERGSTEKGAMPKASDELQADRKKMVDGLIAQGVFREVKRDKNTATIVVAPRFYSLDFKDKQLFVGAVAAWIFEVPKDGKLTTHEEVFLEDSRTGKVIGLFSSDNGLMMD